MRNQHDSVKLSSPCRGEALRSRVISHLSYLKFKKRFTLIELLAVIAIIAILAAMLMPALGKTKDIAKKIACMTCVKNIGAYAQMYVNDFGFFAPGNYTLKENAISQNTDITCPTFLQQGNQGSLACFLALYAPAAKNPPIVANRTLDLRPYLIDFIDPAQDPEIYNYQYYNSCPEVLQRQYTTPRRFDKPEPQKNVRNPSMKINAWCSGEPVAWHSYQVYALNPNHDSYLPGSYRAVPAETAAAKLVKISARNGSEILSRDFMRGRHGEAINTIWLDGHAETLTPEQMIKYDVQASSNGTYNKSYNVNKRGPLCWESPQ